MNIVLCLGGNEKRLDTGIEYAKKHSSAMLIASSFGIKKSVLTERFLDAGLKKERFLIDYSAVDTIGNFVDTLPFVRPLKPSFIFIVTDDYHMRRARAIADIVYAGSGYKLINVPCPTNIPPEPDSKVNAERLQAFFWKATGVVLRDKATLSRKFELDRFANQ